MQLKTIGQGPLITTNSPSNFNQGLLERLPLIKDKVLHLDPRAIKPPPQKYTQITWDNRILWCRPNRSQHSGKKNAYQEILAERAVSPSSIKVLWISSPMSSLALNSIHVQRSRESVSRARTHLSPCLSRDFRKASRAASKNMRCRRCLFLVLASMYRTINGANWMERINFKSFQLTNTSAYLESLLSPKVNFQVLASTMCWDGTSLHIESREPRQRSRSTHWWTLSWIFQTKGLLRPNMKQCSCINSSQTDQVSQPLESTTSTWASD